MEEKKGGRGRESRDRKRKVKKENETLGLYLNIKK